jgi:hypothetical protein
MKLVEKLAKQAVQNQHSALRTIRKEYKIPGYEKGFIDGFNEAVKIIDIGLENDKMPISIRHLVDKEVE